MPLTFVDILPVFVPVYHERAYRMAILTRRTHSVYLPLALTSKHIAREQNAALAGSRIPIVLSMLNLTRANQLRAASLFSGQMAMPMVVCLRVDWCAYGCLRTLRGGMQILCSRLSMSNLIVPDTRHFRPCVMNSEAMHGGVRYWDMELSIEGILHYQAPFSPDDAAGVIVGGGLDNNRCVCMAVHVPSYRSVAVTLLEARFADEGSDDLWETTTAAVQQMMRVVGARTAALWAQHVGSLRFVTMPVPLAERQSIRPEDEFMCQLHQRPSYSDWTAPFFGAADGFVDLVYTLLFKNEGCLSLGVSEQLYVYTTRRLPSGAVEYVLDVYVQLSLRESGSILSPTFFTVLVGALRRCIAEGNRVVVRVLHVAVLSVLSDLSVITYDVEDADRRIASMPLDDMLRAYPNMSPELRLIAALAVFSALRQQDGSPLPAALAVRCESLSLRQLGRRVSMHRYTGPRVYTLPCTCAHSTALGAETSVQSVVRTMVIYAIAYRLCVGYMCVTSAAMDQLVSLNMSLRTLVVRRQDPDMYLTPCGDAHGIHSMTTNFYFVEKLGAWGVQRVDLDISSSLLLGANAGNLRLLMESAVQVMRFPSMRVLRLMFDVRLERPAVRCEFAPDSDCTAPVAPARIAACIRNRVLAVADVFEAARFGLTIEANKLTAQRANQSIQIKLLVTGPVGEELLQA